MGQFPTELSDLPESVLSRNQHEITGCVISLPRSSVKGPESFWEPPNYREGGHFNYIYSPLSRRDNVLTLP